MRTNIKSKISRERDSTLGKRCILYTNSSIFDNSIYFIDFAGVARHRAYYKHITHRIEPIYLILHGYRDDNLCALTIVCPGYFTAEEIVFGLNQRHSHQLVIGAFCCVVISQIPCFVPTLTDY